jgi:regulatory protein
MTSFQKMSSLYRYKMIVEKITKKDSRNVVIHFDNDEKLIINLEVFIKSGLKKGMGVSSDRFSFLIDENRRYYVKLRAIRLLARRPHSEKEIRTKLYQKKYEKEMINDVIDELKEKELLDDYKFAQIFTEEKMRTKLWGEKKMKGELIKKGISRELISQVIEEKFPEGNKLNDAIILAEKKMKTLLHKNLEKRKLAEKIYSYLSSRGYDYETSREAVEKVLDENLLNE